MQQSPSPPGATLQLAQPMEKSDPMKVLMAHNHYLQRGGEDESTRMEVELLRARGHEVVLHTEDNGRLRGMSALRSGARAVWSTESYAQVRRLIRKERPDVVHVQNFFPLLSPAIHWAARREGVPTVQALRNYRLHCANAVLYRAGSVCESCLGKTVALPAIRHGCYRGSRPATAALVAMQTFHRSIGTWTRAVSLFIAPSAFARDKLVEGGLPADRIHVKPNFVFPDPGAGPGDGKYALYVGRLSEEKGIDVLLEAWTRYHPGVRLVMIGDGPMRERVEAARDAGADLELRGRLPIEEAVAAMARATVVVVPSVCYETFGRVAAEAYAVGTPVVATDRGAVPELIDPGRTGHLFRAGDAEDLSRQVDRVLGAPVGEMRTAARARFAALYSASSNYERLMELYALAASPAVARLRAHTRTPA